ncbi:MAG TPA: RodZ domain-containing protein [Stellaceae bacterium]
MDRRPLNPPAASGPPDEASDGNSHSQLIGLLLRRTRESRHIALADAAATLRLRIDYLEAIEKCAYERLPGPAYAAGFIRGYAEYLGLDGGEAVRRFKREVQGGDAPKGLALPVPIAEHSIPGGRLLVTALVLAVCGYGLWYYLSSGNDIHPETVVSVPEALLNPTEPGPGGDPASPGEARASVPARPPAVPTSSLPPGAESAAALIGDAAPPAPSGSSPDEKTAALTPPPADPTGTETGPSPATADAALGPDAPAPGHVFGVGDGPARIVMRFTSDCWIQIKDAKQDIVFGKLLHAGDVYRVPDQAGLSMRVGNSDGFIIWVDGKIATLPPASSRVRNIALDPTQLAGSAGPPLAPVPAAVTAPAPPPPSVQPEND